MGAVTAASQVLFAPRGAAALAHAGFLGVALTTAATPVSPDGMGHVLAVLLSGITVTTVAGVPARSVLGILIG